MRKLNNVVGLENNQQNSNFVINDIALYVPPTSIYIHKEGLDYSVKTLRTKASTKILSGNGVLHAQISLVFPADGILQLHRLICQIKNNPFVMVQNEFISSSFANKTTAIFFTVMGFNISNHPSSPGAFNCELDLRYFNYKVYQEDLGFKEDLYYETYNKENELISSTFSLKEEEDFFVLKKEKEKSESQSIRDDFKNLDKFSEYIKLIKGINVKDPRDSKVYKRYCNWLQIKSLKENFGLIIEKIGKGGDTGRGYFLINNGVFDLLNKGEAGIHEVLVNGKLNSTMKEFRDDLISQILIKNQYTSFYFRNFVVKNFEKDFLTEIRERLEDGINPGMSFEEKEKVRNKNKRNLKTKLIKKYEDKKENIEKEKKELELVFLNTEDTGKIAIGRSPLKYKVVGGSTNYAPITPRKCTIKKTSSTAIDINIEKNQYVPALLLTPFATKRIFFSEESIVFFNEDNKTIIVTGKFKRFAENYLANKETIDVNLEAGDSLIEIATSRIRIVFSDENLMNVYLQGTTDQTKRKEKEEAKRKVIQTINFLKENYQPVGLKGLENVFEEISVKKFLDFSDEDIELITGKKVITKENTSEDSKDGETVIVSVTGGLRNIVASIPIIGQEYPTHQFLGSIEPSYQINFVGVRNRKVNGLESYNESLRYIEEGRANCQHNAKNFVQIADSGNMICESLITKLIGSFNYRSVGYANVTVGGNETTERVIFKPNFLINSSDTFSIDGSPNAVGMNIRFVESKSYSEEEVRPVVSSEKTKDYQKELLKGLEISGIIPQGKVSHVIAKKEAVPLISSKGNLEYKPLDWKTKYFDTRKYCMGNNSILKRKDAYEKVIRTKEKTLLNQDFVAFLVCKYVLDVLQEFFNGYKENNFKVTTFSNLDSPTITHRTTRKNQHFTGGAVDIRVPGINPMELVHIIYELKREGLIKLINEDFFKQKGFGIGIYGSKANDLNNVMKKSGVSVSERTSLGFVHIDFRIDINPTAFKRVTRRIKGEDIEVELVTDYTISSTDGVRKQRWLGENDNYRFPNRTYWSKTPSFYMNAEIKSAVQKRINEMKVELSQ